MSEDKAQFVNVVLIHDGVVKQQWLYPYERADEAEKRFIETAEKLYGEKFSAARLKEVLDNGFFESLRFSRPRCVCLSHPEMM